MKIALIHHFGGIGGGLISCLDISRMLIELNNDVTVYIPNPDDQVKTLFNNNGVNLVGSIPEVVELTYHSASSNGFVALVKHFLSQRNRKSWGIFLGNLDADVVILNSLVQAPMIPLVKSCNKKCILFIRETIRGISNSFVNKYLKRKINMADAVVYLTEYDRRTWNITEEVKQYVIPDIVNPKYFSNSITEQLMDKRIDEDKTAFMYLGGLSYVKGAFDLLAAFEKYLERGNSGKLLMLGSSYDDFLSLKGIKRLLHHKDCSYINKCKETIKRINDKFNSIEWIGLTKNPEKWYVQSDVVVFPVKKVHQARPVYEAGYFEKTVILPLYDNFGEAVTNGVNGLFYAPDDVDDLASKMDYINHHKTELRNMGIQNRLKYEQKHTYECALRMVKKVMSEI